MEITLKINGSDKTFTQEFVPMKIYRKALEIEKKIQSKELDDFQILDERENLVVEIFDKQFTKTDIEEGLNAINHDKVLYEIIGVNILGYAPIEEQKELGKFLEELKENALQLNNKSNE